MNVDEMLEKEFDIKVDDRHHLNYTGKSYTICGIPRREITGKLGEACFKGSILSTCAFCPGCGAEICKKCQQRVSS